MSPLSRTPIAILLGALLLSAAAAAQTSPSAEEREHAAAWGAHHLCAGLYVVGRALRRPPDTVIARDIARFPVFRWEPTFRYQVDSGAHRVTVTAPGAPPRTAVSYNFV